MTLLSIGIILKVMEETISKRDNKGRFIKGVNFSQSESWKRAIKKRWKDFQPERIKKICIVCKKNFEVYLYRKDTAKFCSHSCKGIYIGRLRRERAIPILRYDGYMYIRMPSYHRNHEGYAKISDLILEQKIGRLLKKNEIAHHIDGCKTN
ncbi:hypothetical protein LCGC14_2547460, partial [marine sediment metagenome]